MVADADVGGAAAILQVLGLSAEAGEREDLVVGSQLRVPLDDDVRMQGATRSKDDVFTEDTEGPDGAILADDGVGMDDGGGMDGRRHGLGCRAGRVSGPSA